MLLKAWALAVAVSFVANGAHADAGGNPSTTSNSKVSLEEETLATPKTAYVAKTSVEVARSIIIFRVRTKRGGGTVRCGLYDEKKHWLTSRYILKSTADIDDRSAICQFTDVAPGIYAISAYHDRNNNGEFDRNFLGLPKEDYTFSSGAKARLRPPKFKEASFKYDGGALQLKGKM